jgi:hypothetical protein
MEPENVTRKQARHVNLFERHKMTSHTNRKGWKEMLVDDENRGIADAERHIVAMLIEMERIKPWSLREF